MKKEVKKLWGVFFFLRRIVDLILYTLMNK